MLIVEVYAFMVAASLKAESVDTRVDGRSLVSRLRLDPTKDGDFASLPVQLLRKYVAYARNFVFPR